MKKEDFLLRKKVTSWCLAPFVDKSDQLVPGTFWSLLQNI